MPIDLNSISLRRISEVQYEDILSFSCGRKQLDDFLKDQASDFEAYGLTSTILAYVPNFISSAAYFSLSADSVQLTLSEQSELGLPFNAPITYYPAVKITKLAVASNLQNIQLGKHLINLICGIASEANFAVRLITVDAVNSPEVIKFYEKNGFVESLAEFSERKQQKKRKTLLMIKDLYL